MVLPHLSSTLFPYTTLFRSHDGLRFLVFDELHTYRGRQGADVAMLIRRLKERCAGPEVICVGTSATDRKSTRLNSSHVSISYAVFCLKKKTRVLRRSYA